MTNHENKTIKFVIIIVISIIHIIKFKSKYLFWLLGCRAPTSQGNETKVGGNLFEHLIHLFDISVKSLEIFAKCGG